MFTVIAFDIVDDRIRYRVVKALRRYAVRVQKSVFESAALSATDFQRLREEIEELIDPKVDAVRYYLLCGSCIPRIELSGCGRVTRHLAYVVL